MSMSVNGLTNLKCTFPGLLSSFNIGLMDSTKNDLQFSEELYC